jgi:hypothetical protein
MPRFVEVIEMTWQIYWLLGLVLGTFLLMILGYYYSRESSHEDRLATIGKFGAVGLSVIFFGVAVT